MADEIDIIVFEKARKYLAEDNVEEATKILMAARTYDESFLDLMDACMKRRQELKEIQQRYIDNGADSAQAHDKYDKHRTEPPETIKQHDKSQNTEKVDTTSVKEAKQILEAAKAAVREAMAAAKEVKEAQGAVASALKEVKEAQGAVASALKEGKAAMEEAAATTITAVTKVQTAMEETLKERWTTIEESIIKEVTTKARTVIEEAIKEEKTKMEEATAETIIKEAHTAVKEVLEKRLATMGEEITSRLTEVTKEAQTVMDELLNEGKNIVDKAKAAAREATAAVTEVKVIADETKLTQTQTPRTENNQDSNRNNNQPHNPDKPVDLQTSISDKELAEKCIVNAQKAYAEKDFKKAHRYLLKAKYFDPDANIKDILADVEFILNYKEEQVKKHNKMADEAINKKDYREAEKILVKALEIDPTADLNDKLASVRVNIEKTVQVNQAKKDNSSIEASGYLNSADIAIRNKDFKQAETLLMKVVALNVNIDVQDKLTQVRKQIEKDVTRGTNNDVSEEQLVKVQEYIQQARDLMFHRNYYGAESWLKLANGTHTTETGEELMIEVQKELNCFRQKDIEMLRKIDARWILDKAQISYYANQFEMARLQVIVSENVCNTFGSARDLMRKIFRAMYMDKQKNKHKFNSSHKESIDKFIANCCKEAAFIALTMNDSKLAQNYLEKSNLYLVL